MIDEEIDEANPHDSRNNTRRRLISRRRGFQKRTTKICGLAEAVGLTNLSANGYQPSAAFVSLQAACLSVGRLLARLMNANDEANLIQYDALIGPEQLTSEKLRESKTCYCQQRSNTIKAVRELRHGPSRINRVRITGRRLRRRVLAASIPVDELAKNNTILIDDLIHVLAAIEYASRHQH